MTDIDPFAKKAADEAQAETQPEAEPTESIFDNAPAEAPKKTTARKKAAPKVTDNIDIEAIGSQVRITFKGGAAYDVPWMTADYKSIQDAFEDLADAERQRQLADLFDIVARANAKFVEVVGEIQPSSKPKSGGGGNAQSAPQAAKEAPGGEKKFCKHGEMEFKSGVSKQGKAYALFSCTAPRDEQCKAQFPDKR